MNEGLVEQRAFKPAVRLVNLQRSFSQGGRDLHVLKGAGADLYPGQAVALVGPSGSGKSSLLHIIGLLEQPQGGSVIIGDRDCVALPDGERTRLRRTQIGFVYQFHHLLPEFSALENVVLPQMIAGVSRVEAEHRGRDLLASFGLTERATHRPAELSGGEQQRVAIARAVANHPRLLLADEPTGNLDPPTADRVFEQLVGFIQKTGLAALIATHNFELAERMDRILRLEDGLLVEQPRGYVSTRETASSAAFQPRAAE
ncbi:MAG: ABC transporter ATP-binding protein [Hyphomicrobiales bacterium]|nr:ABC transporter ATP-binding protein [Hyphomicrobiales bacterium]